MKRFLIISILIVPIFSRAQIFGEFFQQKKTDLKYLAQQIAAFAEYIKDIEKGYEIAKEGLGLIGEIKNGEFDLHSVFFGSLKKLNPAITKYSKVGDIISYEDGINRDIKSLRNATNLNQNEKDYVSRVSDNLKAEVKKDMDLLLNTITDDELTLNDAERIRIIDNLYSDMKDKFSFAESFLVQVKMIAADRTFERNESEFLKSMYR